jgi:hypothetical protein
MREERRCLQAPFETADVRTRGSAITERFSKIETQGQLSGAIATLSLGECGN